MRGRMCFAWMLIAALIAATTSIAADAPFQEQNIRKVPGAFYFTPAAGHGSLAAFGYMSKIRPTPKEIAAEKARIRAILDSTVRKGYGSWSRYERAMSAVGRETAKKIGHEGPEWMRTLLPRELVEKGIPLLMRGALLWAMQRGEQSKAPYGNVGETGVVLTDIMGHSHKIPLALNAPVVALEFSPDGDWLAVLLDRSFEDQSGRLHLLGQISIVDVTRKEAARQWILAKLGERLHFSPDGKWLGFEIYTDPHDFSRRALRLIRTSDWHIDSHSFAMADPGGGTLFGQEQRFPGFAFLPDGGYLVLFEPGHRLAVREIHSGQEVMTIPGQADGWCVAHHHPWVMTGRREIWDVSGRHRMDALPPRLKEIRLTLYQCQWNEEDTQLYYLESGFVSRYDMRQRRIAARSPDVPEAGIFRLAPDDRYLVAFHEERPWVKIGGTLRRHQNCLRVFDTLRLRQREKLCLPRDTFLDAVFLPGTLIASSPAYLHFYRTGGIGEAGAATVSPVPVVTLREIASDPARYFGRTLTLEGWAWGWAASDVPPEIVRLGKLPFAKGNRLLNRSWGTFSDGDALAYLPVAPDFAGHVRIRVRVRPAEGGWVLEPVH